MVSHEALGKQQGKREKVKREGGRVYTMREVGFAPQKQGCEGGERGGG